MFPLACGGLDVGGGQSTMPEGIFSPGTANRFLVDCTGDDCVVSPTTAASACWDCTTTDCFFGAPQPIDNGGVSLCLVSRFAAPVSGTIDRSTGRTTNLSIDLVTNVALVGIPGGIYTQPDSACPVCQLDGVAAHGSTSAPAAGTCNGGARADLPCTTMNPEGLTRDCLPGGVCRPGDPGCSSTFDDCAPGSSCRDGSLNLGSIGLDLAPLATSPQSRTTRDGLFCPGQRTAQVGCFGRASDVNPAGFPECRTITVDGTAPGTSLLSGEPAAVTLASVFCVPPAMPVSSGGGIDGIVNVALNLPGPGAVKLPGTFTFNDPGAP